MNPNIEVITPDLWAVNSEYVKAGWIRELTPIAGVDHHKNQYVSLTDDGIMVLKKESELYPMLKQFVPRIMRHTDQELQSCSRIVCSKGALNDYERVYKSVLEWEVKRRAVRALYLQAFPRPKWKSRIIKLLQKVGEFFGFHWNKY